MGKIKLSKQFIRLAYRFVDVEASGETAIPDERMIEYSFVLSRLLKNNTSILKVLDVGCLSRMNLIPATLCEIGHHVWGMDIRKFKYRHLHFCFVQGDIRKTGFPNGFFDVVCAVSTLEHIGIKGRYGISTKDMDGDAAAVHEIKRILDNNGKFLVTLPYGDSKDSVLGRMYNDERLDKLFHGWNTESKIFYCQDENGFWVTSPDDSNKRESLVLLELCKS